MLGFKPLPSEKVKAVDPQVRSPCIFILGPEHDFPYSSIISSLFSYNGFCFLVAWDCEQKFGSLLWCLGQVCQFMGSYKDSRPELCIPVAFAGEWFLSQLPRPSIIQTVYKCLTKLCKKKILGWNRYEEWWKARNVRWRGNSTYIHEFL